jgi:hypothetical protein
MHKFLTSFFVSAIFSLNVYAADSCDSVLQYTGLSSLKSLDATEASDLDYYFNCTETGKNKSGNLGIAYEALKINIGGSSYTTTGSCTEKVRNIDESKLKIVLQSEPFEAAITAWLSCKTASSNNIDVKMFDDPDAVGINIENPTTGKLTFWVAGTRLDGGIFQNVNNECTVVPPTSMGTSNGNLLEVNAIEKSFVTVSCAKTVVSENRDGIFTRYNPSMNIRLASKDVSPISFPFVENIIDGGKVKRLDDAEENIKALQAKSLSLQSGLDVLGTNPAASWQESGMNNFTWSGNPTYALGQCPQGQYVAGIEARGANAGVKFCQGCLVGVRILCKPLK